MMQDKKKSKWPLLGNGHIIDFLDRSITNNSLAGAYIFNGPDNLGKTTIANFFAKILLCQETPLAPLSKGGVNLPCGECSSCRSFYSESAENKNAPHSDLHILKKEKDKKNISIEDTREFIRKLSMSSFLNSYKIGIIKHADSLSEEAANALLKTLEEPKNNVIIILITSNIESMPQTIVSRAQVLRFNSVPTEIIYDYLVKERQATRSAAKNFSRMCAGRPALAVKFLEDKEFYDNYLEKVKIFFDFISEDTNGRFSAIEKLVGAKTVGQESVALAGRVLEVWLGLTRDLYLLEFDRGDLIQHEIALDDLMKAKQKLSLASLFKINKLIEQAKSYLRNNVNAKLALESIAVNI
jgi:DNA polymerase-3 subunit delta'